MDLKIESVAYYSNTFQLIDSELYKKGISLKKQEKEIQLRELGLERRLEYERKSDELSSLHKGDQAAFLLKAI